MISYAQNFEDVMLWRALKHIDQGFYIDVGAWSPDLDSVTRFFYENGWHGINVEPNPEFHQQYLSKREHDINLKLALSDNAGITTIYFVENPGLSSLMKSVAESHEKLGYSSRAEEVTVSTLADICAEHAPQQDIHFLKVDVEGLEKQVLLGNDWQQFRPWIVVVEATKPMSQEENHQEWEDILLTASYQFAYADGLNRFYIAREHQNLLPAFQYPPNVFDEFVLFPQIQAESQAKRAEDLANQAESQAKRAEDLANQAEDRTRQAQDNLALVQQELEAVFQSRSWKITKPLRDVLGFKRQLMDKGKAYLQLAPGTLPRRSIEKALVLTRNGLARYPAIKQGLITLVDLVPGLKQRLKKMIARASVDMALKLPRDYEELSPHARSIYKRLEHAIEHRED